MTLAIRDPMDMRYGVNDQCLTCIFSGLPSVCREVRLWLVVDLHPEVS